MVVKTSYGTGPYRILSIVRGCTCGAYLEIINGHHEHRLPPHIHLVCEWAGPESDKSAGPFYLNQYDEETLTCIGHCDYEGKFDTLEIVKTGELVQASLDLF